MLHNNKIKAWLTLKMLIHVAIVITGLWMRVLFGKVNKKVTEEYARWFWQGLLRISRTRLRIRRAKNTPKGGMCVYMSNHLSHMDIPVIFATVEKPVRMIMKQELMRFPLFSHALSRLGFVAINRKNPVQGFRQLQQAKQTLIKGIPIWIAPEGSRSRTNQLAPMRRGGFHLAIQLGVPIVPIWIDGTQQVLPPGGRSICYGQTVVTYVGEPIETRGLKPDRTGIASLMQKFRIRLTQLKLRKDLHEKSVFPIS